MTLRKSFILLVCITLLLGNPSFTPAQQGASSTPLTNAQIDKAISTIRATMKQPVPTREERTEANRVAGETLQELNLAGATLEQITRILEEPFADYLSALLLAVRPRLLELSKSSSKEGLQAGITLVSHYLTIDERVSLPKNKEWLEAFKSLLNRPEIPNLLQKDEGTALKLILLVQEMDSKAMKETKLLEALLPILDLPMPPSLVLALPQLFDRTMDEECNAEMRETYRKKVLEHVEKALQSLRATNRRNALFDHLEYSRRYLTGPAARGVLIGNPAPDISFKWSTGSFERLVHLKGKIVVLDFWATFCNGYVAQFPNIRKLQERYSGYPVVILSVTSPQPYHNDPKAKKNINTEGNPTKEITLMRQFIREMQMTWFVAFSNSNVFDPNYGVRAIPHATLIAPDGTVRYNDLLSYEAPYHKAEKIDALLKEFNLPYPKTPMEQKNWAE